MINNYTEKRWACQPDGGWSYRGVYHENKLHHSNTHSAPGRHMANHLSLRWIMFQLCSLLEVHSLCLVKAGVFSFRTASCCSFYLNGIYIRIILSIEIAFVYGLLLFIGLRLEYE